MRVVRLRCLIASASVMLVASCGFASGATTPEAAGLPSPSALPTASRANQLAVTRFIDRLRARHLAVQPDAEWAAGRLLFAVPHPRARPWPALNGRVVGGLEVTVLHATVSTKEYEHAIATIGHATFPDHSTVVSFDYPPDGSYILVRVRRLGDLDAARQAALTANLERLAGAPVHLANAPHNIPLVATLHSGTVALTV